MQTEYSLSKFDTNLHLVAENHCTNYFGGRTSAGTSISSSLEASWPKYAITAMTELRMNLHSYFDSFLFFQDAARQGVTPGNTGFFSRSAGSTMPLEEAKKILGIDALPSPTYDFILQVHIHLISSPSFNCVN
jgi:hypothetical protein